MSGFIEHTNACAYVLVYYAWCTCCGMHCGLVVMSMVSVCTCTMYIQNVHAYVHVCV